jgi:hypothetical protein
MMWQPIETAPKDEWIILTNGETVAAGCWADTPFQEFRDSEGRYVDQVDAWAGWADVLGGMQPDPTHWMALPEPPTEPVTILYCTQCKAARTSRCIGPCHECGNGAFSAMAPTGEKP